MTYPKSLKSTKTLMLAEIMFLICEFFIILTAGATSVVYLFAEQLGERLSGFLLIVIYGSALLAIVIKVVGYILCLVSSRRASAEDDNFKVSFYSIILTLLIITASTVFVLNKEVQSISDLLVTLTALLADVYILEGLRSLCKQLDHPEMDKRGGIIYAVITTFFVLQTCGSVYILVVGGTLANIGAAVFEIFGSLLGIIQSVLLLRYFKTAYKILKTE